MEVEEHSRPFITINTARGLYQYHRLPYGVASAPAIGQRAMDQILQGIPGVFCYLDDIIATGSTMEEHLERLVVVLKRLEEYGLKANREKCKFLRSFVEYLGHVISTEGLHQSPKKVKAYDPDLPLVLATDSSSYGLGAVLSHRIPEGVERPIAYASRSLSEAEKKYSQIEKEALSLVWGVKKFQTYLEGRHFTLVTDH